MIGDPSRLLEKSTDRKTGQVPESQCPSSLDEHGLVRKEFFPAQRDLASAR